MGSKIVSSVNTLTPVNSKVCDIRRPWGWVANNDTLTEKSF